ncbi:MAG TPA: hypothetical protein VFB66_01075 [Tepidisphaeraceae bacterium]|nr:hypothetical protein [Tepidisphaeraceae bacterium]
MSGASPISFEAQRPAPVGRLATLADRWRRFWFEPVAPDNLGFCRLLFYGLLLYYFFPVHFVGWANVPESFRDPIWLFERFHLPILPDPALPAAGAAFKAALLLACVGLGTRMSTAVAFLLGTYLIGMRYNFGKTDHVGAILVFTMGILALSRCGDAWSIDSLVRRKRAQKRGEPNPAQVLSGEYRWPVRAVWVVMVMVFFAAGVAKVVQGGAAWVFSDHFAISLIQRYYDPSPPGNRIGLFVANHAWLAHTLAAAAVLVELTIPLAMFSRRARLVLPPALFLMQLGIGIVMNVWFTSFMYAYLFWVPWDRVLGKLRRQDRSA